MIVNAFVAALPIVRNAHQESLRETQRSLRVEESFAPSGKDHLHMIFDLPKKVPALPPCCAMFCAFERAKLESSLNLLVFRLAL